MSWRTLQQCLRLLRTYSRHYRNRRRIGGLIAESDAEARRQQQGKYEYPEDNLRFALQFQHARAEEMKIPGPAPVSPCRIFPRNLSLRDWSLFSNTHKSNKKMGNSQKPCHPERSGLLVLPAPPVQLLQQEDTGIPRFTGITAMKR